METKPQNFIEQIVETDLSSGLPSSLRFRFPPEPNGFLHIGHTKALGINFGLAEKYRAPVNLRFDDTNPSKEDQRFVDAIKKDIKWMGYTWSKETYSSDCFEQLYLWALQLIKNEHAYVDSQNSSAIATQKGTPTSPGTNSPYRNRPAEESLALFESMKNGESKEGELVLRAKIDMTHSNMLMRDPIIYRVLNKPHHRTSTDWKIYQMYDWAPGQCDYIEQVSHSLCSLEFKPHRDLYNWFLDALSPLDKVAPKQREFARMNLSYTVTSKRKLMELIQEGVVKDWDDPRMPTIAGLRRRGYTPTSLRNFVDAAGVAKRDNVIDMSLLEYSIREDLNIKAPRVMAVLNPVKLTLSNYPEGKEEFLEGEINPEQPELGSRTIPFSKHLLIEREDFKEEANRKFFRLTIDKEVRLKNGYIIKGESVIKDASGNITEIICTYDPESKSGSGTEASMRKVKGTLHWVSEPHALAAEVRLYDRLFQVPAPDQDKEVDFKSHVNPSSLSVIKAYVEPSLKTAKAFENFQFQRLGYFVVDADSDNNKLVFNKTVGLRDTWAKQNN